MNRYRMILYFVFPIPFSFVACFFLCFLAAVVVVVVAIAVVAIVVDSS